MNKPIRNCGSWASGLVFLSLLLVTAHTQAESEGNSGERWLLVDYILFEHLATDRSVLRHEQPRLDPAKPAGALRYMSRASSASSPTQNNQVLARLNNYPLDAAAGHLRYLRREFRIWSRGHWEQPKPGKRPLPVQLETESRLTANETKLQGTINIRRHRYYHVDIDASLYVPMRLPWESLLDWVYTAESQRWPLSWLLLPMSAQQAMNNNFGSTELPMQLIRFKASRRMKVGEIHYLDHPAMGLLVTVREIERPQGS